MWIPSFRPSKKCVSNKKSNAFKIFICCFSAFLQANTFIPPKYFYIYPPSPPQKKAGSCSRLSFCNSVYSLLYHAIENTTNQNTRKPLIFHGIAPSLPIMRHAYVTLCWPRIFYGMLYNYLITESEVVTGKSQTEALP